MESPVAATSKPAASHSLFSLVRLVRYGIVRGGPPNGGEGGGRSRVEVFGLTTSKDLSRIFSSRLPLAPYSGSCETRQFSHPVPLFREGVGGVGLGERTGLSRISSLCDIFLPLSRSVLRWFRCHRPRLHPVRAGGPAGRARGASVARNALNHPPPVLLELSPSSPIVWISE